MAEQALSLTYPLIYVKGEKLFILLLDPTSRGNKQ